MFRLLREIDIIIILMVSLMAQMLVLWGMLDGRRYSYFSTSDRFAVRASMVSSRSSRSSMSWLTAGSMRTSVKSGEDRSSKPASPAVPAAWLFIGVVGFWAARGLLRLSLDATVILQFLNWVVLAGLTWFTVSACATTPIHYGGGALGGDTAASFAFLQVLGGVMLAAPFFIMTRKLWALRFQFACELIEDTA